MGELDKNASVIALVYLYKEARFEDHTACGMHPYLKEFIALLLPT